MTSLNLILGIFERDFVKVKDQPEMYEEWKYILKEKIASAKQEDKKIDLEFFENFEYPVHP